jgi:3,4-dihydroxy-2-butanone 4-phosphate synthase
MQVTPADVEFLRKHTSGFICVGMDGAALDRLQLPLMVSSAENDEAMYTAFTVTVDARHGITTGISAADRARTLRLLANPAAGPRDFRRPGHICPLRSAGAATPGFDREPPGFELMSSGPWDGVLGGPEGAAIYAATFLR